MGLAKARTLSLRATCRCAAVALADPSDPADGAVGPHEKAPPFKNGHAAVQRLVRHAVFARQRLQPTGQWQTLCATLRALFAGGRVHAWQDIVVPHAMDTAAFEAFVQAQAARLGLALDQPFVFRVEGRFPHWLWHVVTGGQKPSGHGGHGDGPGVGDWAYANQRSDMRLFRQPGASGQLVGVYSGSSLEGAVTHPGERFRLQYADGAVSVSGHVDRYSVAAGSVLKLPRR